MSVLKTKKINIKDAKPKMVLAKDVVNSSGVIILSKDTTLNELNYDKLKFSGIKFITIFEKDDFEEVKDLNIENKEEFVKFKKKYNQNLKKVENQFIAIGKGVGVEVDSLYSIVIDMLEKVNVRGDILSYLANLKQQDLYTYAHCLNVGILCNLFGMWIGYEDTDLKNLTIAGILHDVGKTQVDEELIKKPEKLTDKEYSHIKEHAYLGYKLIENLDIPDEIKSGVLMHHEKIDGSGYPLGLKDDKITTTAKIVAICDIYEAMTADRVYRPKVCPFEVIKNFEQNCYNVLDTRLLLAFLQNIVYTYIGSDVMLSDGRVAKVVFINQANLSKPIVRIDDTFIDLSIEKDMYIKHII